jgi:phage shock protein C
MTTRTYALDKSNAKILGVCAGLARSAGWDPTLVRIGAVASTLFLLGPLTILFYIIVAALAASR